MTDTERALEGAVRRRTTVRVRGVEDTGPFPGRHASRVEIAAETPIFHALTVGGWRSRQPEPAAPRRRRSAEELDEFRRDPLTAPIPVQAFATLAKRPVAASAGGHDRPLYAAHVPAYAPPSPSYTSLTDTGPHALPELSSRPGRHHRSVGSGSGLTHLP